MGSPGIPLEITGTVYRADGKTPAAGVVIYAWHDNARGVYMTRGGEIAGAGDHGQLRYWVRTDDAGHYRFTTIHPGASRDHRTPALVNITVAPPGGRELRADPIILGNETAVGDTRAGVVHPITDAQGVQHVVRDIVLRRES